MLTWDAYLGHLTGSFISQSYLGCLFRILTRDVDLGCFDPVHNDSPKECWLQSYSIYYYYYCLHRVSCILGWLRAPCVVEDILEHLLFLLLLYSQMLGFQVCHIMSTSYFTNTKPSLEKLGDISSTTELAEAGSWQDSGLSSQDISGSPPCQHSVPDIPEMQLSIWPAWCQHQAFLKWHGFDTVRQHLVTECFSCF